MAANKLLFVVALVVAAVTTGCGGGGGPAPPSIIDGDTDSEGYFPITQGGETGAIQVLDGASSQPLQGIHIEVALSGTTGTMLLTDPSGEYLPRLAPLDISDTQAQISPDGLYSWIRRAVLQSWRSHTLGGSEIVYNDLLPQGMTLEILQESYYLQDRVTLAQLDSKLTNWAIHWLIDQGADVVIIAALSLVGTPAAGVTYLAITKTVAPFELLADSIENLIFTVGATTYRIRGYTDDQSFELWYMKRSSQHWGRPIVIVPLDYPERAPHQDLWTELSWDTGTTDVDLHLIAPPADVGDFGTSLDCYYANMQPSWGAELDIDDVDGYGPEHITMSNVSPGRYLLIVHYYRGEPIVTTARVTVRTGSQSRTFGSLRLDSSGWYGGDAWEVCHIDFPSGNIQELRRLTSRAQANSAREERK